MLNLANYDYICIDVIGLTTALQTAWWQGMWKGRGRPRICWFDNIMAWTGLSGFRLLHATRDRRCWSFSSHPCSLPSHGDDGALTWHDINFLNYLLTTCYYDHSKAQIIFSEHDVVVGLSSVTFVRSTQAVEIVGNVSTPFGTLTICDLSVKIYGLSPRETPPLGVKHEG